MHSLKHITITETHATHAIITACRANEKREPRKVGAWSVEFTKLTFSNGEYRANVRATGSTELAATAVVDQYDI